MSVILSFETVDERHEHQETENYEIIAMDQYQEQTI